MKILLSLALICLIATSCSVGTKKDFVTGLSVSYNGFSIGENYLVNADNQRTSSNQVMYGKTIAIVVDNIQNYEIKDGRAFPVLDLIVADKNGVVVLEGKDILKNEEGYTPEDASTLRGTITAAIPMKAGETYHATMKISDKLKPKSEITAEVDIVVTETGV